MTSPEPEHLNNRHRDTLRQIFAHPVGHNVEWRAVLSLLEAVGTVAVRHDGKVEVTVGPVREFLDPPRGLPPVLMPMRPGGRRAGFGLAPFRAPHCT